MNCTREYYYNCTNSMTGHSATQCAMAAGDTPLPRINGGIQWIPSVAHFKSDGAPYELGEGLSRCNDKGDCKLPKGHGGEHRDGRGVWGSGAEGGRICKLNLMNAAELSAPTARLPLEATCKDCGKTIERGMEAFAWGASGQCGDCAYEASGLGHGRRELAKLRDQLGDKDHAIAELHAKVGQLTMERDDALRKAGRR